MVNIAVFGFVLCATVCVTGLLMIRAFREGLNAQVKVEKEVVVEKAVEYEEPLAKNGEKTPDSIENMINEWLNGESEKERG